MRLNIPEPTPFISYKGIMVECGYKSIIVDYGLESGFYGVGISSEILDNSVVRVHARAMLYVVGEKRRREEIGQLASSLGVCPGNDTR